MQRRCSLISDTQEVSIYRAGRVCYANSNCLGEHGLAIVGEQEGSLVEPVILKDVPGTRTTACNNVILLNVKCEGCTVNSEYLLIYMYSSSECGSAPGFYPENHSSRKIDVRSSGASFPPLDVPKSPSVHRD